MYKNFKITEKEKQEILESHMYHGYKKPLNETEVKPINELDSKDIDLIRGVPDFKTQTGRPVGDYLVKRAAAKQFQQDFQKEFPDPADEPISYWEKDQARPSEDSEIESDIRTNIRQADRELGKKPEREVVSSNQKFREERLKLRRKIASLVSHKEEFGGDDELDRVIERLRARAREMDNI